jgi:hypothetical protein
MFHSAKSKKQVIHPRSSFVQRARQVRLFAPRQETGLFSTIGEEPDI